MDPVAVLEWTLVESDILPPRLLAVLDSELMSVRRQVTDPIQASGGPVRHDAVRWRAFPCRYFGSELEPCCSQLQVVGRR